MKNFTTLILVILGLQSHLSHGTCVNPGALCINDFQGDQLVIGAGTNSYFLFQRKTSNKLEYSIDLNRRTYPCLIADGLNPGTYESMPNDRFEMITFEHISLCPYSRDDIIHSPGNCKGISTLVYTAEAWRDSLIEYDPLITQLYRILRPQGILTFKTPVLRNREYFTTMCMDRNEAGLLEGFQCWQHMYMQAGFEDLTFEICYQKKIDGWYAQMTARKPKLLKRQKGDTLPTLSVSSVDFTE